MRAFWWRAFRGSEPEDLDRMDDLEKSCLTVLVGMWLVWIVVAVIIMALT